jgi:NAD(P)H-hydrate epimerase
MALPISTAQEMGRVDARAIESYGIPSACLMETAGTRAADLIWEEYGRSGLRVLVVAGKGNNGGDGFVIARHLLNRGAAVRVFTLFPTEEAGGDPALFLQILSKMQSLVDVATDAEGLVRLKAAATESDVMVDAILGTGFSPPARGFVSQVLATLGEIEIPVAAVDIPSGLDASTGAGGAPHLKADLTVTFGTLKRGHFLMPAAEYVGKLALADIGIPAACLAEEGIPLQLIEAPDVAALLPKRRLDAHKGDAGNLLIVAGSKGLMGAAIMAAQGALRIGAGKVTLAVPEPLVYAVESGPPEIMAIPLPATSGGTIDPAAFDLILEQAETMEALVVGPGLSTHPRTVELVHRLIQHIEKPILLDADGLNALSQAMTVLEGPRAELIMTPHPGEMARLGQMSTSEVQADRINFAIHFATQHRVHLALKGAHTVLAMPGGNAWLNPTGNPALASGGTGDVLAGACGGLLAQGLSPEEGLMAGVYLHGLAGDIAAQKVGGIGLTATDLLPALPLARKQVLDPEGEEKT